MQPNPYESPAAESARQGIGERHGTRLMTVAVFVMLAALMIVCVALTFLAWWLTRQF